MKSGLSTSICIVEKYFFSTPERNALGIIMKTRLKLFIYKAENLLFTHHHTIT